MTPSPQVLMTLSGVDKEYNLRPVLHSINLDVLAGCRYLLTAENGSGKTTLLRLMAGLSSPTRGRVLWKGKPLSANARHRIGVLLQAPMLYGDLTGEENLRLFAELYLLPRPREMAAQWMDTLGLQWAKKRLVREYSKGMRQRVSLARCLIHEPELVLLDEPFDGLDEEATNITKTLLRDVTQRGATVFMAGHMYPSTTDHDIRLSIRKGQIVQTEQVEQKEVWK